MKKNTERVKCWNPSLQDTIIDEVMGVDQDVLREKNERERKKMIGQKKKKEVFTVRREEFISRGEIGMVRFVPREEGFRVFGLSAYKKGSVEKGSVKRSKKRSGTGIKDSSGLWGLKLSGVLVSMPGKGL
ncbi:hypothetical protein CEXT_12641 [Caerostris extrusa]|uniref:Uncharacterized protein n=1 Tax=Caerostris extrusa TaxID=172846 RepID=A0AAV4VZT6_CAEEX|nr:hypothetical protein CEXT_12641 [Caerostris extrusa]